jgi:hypothetical protein
MTAILMLLAAHYLADFALQNDYVATAKAHVHDRADGIHALVAHAAHHATLIAIALAVLGGDWMLGALIVGVTHALIDYGKAVHQWYGIHVDQLAHIIILIVVAVVCT